MFLKVRIGYYVTDYNYNVSFYDLMQVICRSEWMHTADECAVS